MAKLLLHGEDTAEDGLNAERGKNTRSESGGKDFFGRPPRISPAGELIVAADVTAEGRKRACCFRVCSDLARSDGSVQPVSQMISEHNQSIGVLEWKRAEQDTLDQGKDRRCGADAQSQGEDDGQCEAGRFAQLAKFATKILCERVHASWRTLKSGAQQHGRH